MSQNTVRRAADTFLMLPNSVDTWCQKAKQAEKSATLKHSLMPAREYCRLALYGTHKTRPGRFSSTRSTFYIPPIQAGGFFAGVNEGSTEASIRLPKARRHHILAASLKQYHLNHLLSYSNALSLGSRLVGCVGHLFANSGHGNDPLQRIPRSATQDSSQKNPQQLDDRA